MRTGVSSKSSKNCNRGNRSHVGLGAAVKVFTPRVDRLEPLVIVSWGGLLCINICFAGGVGDGLPGLWWGRLAGETSGDCRGASCEDCLEYCVVG